MAILKQLNAEDKQYRPILVDQLVLDTKPTVGSTNAITSDAVANAISGSGSVPTPAAGDDGKVLTASNGSYEWSDPTGGESYTAGTGITISEQNAIAVTDAISTGAAAGATAVQPSDLSAVATSGDYADLSGTPTINNVPAVTSSDDNKILKATYSEGVGSYAWATGEGGSSYTAGDGITIDNNEVSVRIKNDSDNALKVTQEQGGGGDADLWSPEGTPSSEGWKALTDNGYLHIEYDSKDDVTHIEFRYRWDRVDSNPLGMQSTGDDTKHFDAKCNLLYISSKESYTNIVATSSTVSDAFTAAWDELNEVCVYNLGSLVDTTDGYVFQIGFTLPGDVGGVFNAIAFSASGQDFSGISDTVQSSFLNENHVLALQGSSVYIVGDTIPGGDLYVQVDQTYDSVSALPQSGYAVAEAISYVNQVPYSDISDEGKVLTVDSNGDPAWATSGGSSSSVSVGMAYPPVDYPSYTSAETNPLNLSANTIRCKFTAGFDPSQVNTYFTWTLVDATDNIWDGYNANTDWDDNGTPLFNEAASHLEEVLGANTSSLTSIKSLFENCDALTSVALFDTSSCTSLYRMFYLCSLLTAIPALDTSSCTDFEGFCTNSALTAFQLIDTSKATTLAHAFRGCSSLTAIPMLDTANCTDFLVTFQDCSSIEEVPLLDTSKGQSFSGMFVGCTGLKHIPLFATESAGDVGNMFDGCVNVEYGALQLYQQMTSQAHVPSSHDDTFRDCGSQTTNGSAELAQIDPSWGGTAV